MKSDVILELSDVTKHFPLQSFRRKRRVVHAMDRISFSLRKGEILGIVGESGSGKTTTANVISRIYYPTDGRVVFEGEDVHRKMKRNVSLKYHKKVQMIFQDPFASLNLTHTVRGILERPFKIHKLVQGKKEIELKIKEMLVQVGLDPPEQFIDKFPHELSGGQRQRVSIARAFAVNPELVLADEPTSMLDVSNRMSIMNQILNLSESMEVSYIYITHDLAGARYMSDRIIVMYAGTMLEVGAAEEVIQQAFHPYTRLLKSAAASPETGLKRKRLVTKGDIPSLIEPPAGCRFHPRCPFVMPECSMELPEMREISDQHYVRCLLES